MANTQPTVAIGLDQVRELHEDLAVLLSETDGAAGPLSQAVQMMNESMHLILEMAEDEGEVFLTSCSCDYCEQHGGCSDTEH